MASALKSNLLARSLLILPLLLAVLAINPNTSASIFQKEQMTFEQHLENARVAMQAAKYNTAEKELKLALKLNKDSPDANLLMSIVYRHKGKYKEGIKHAQAALKHRPDFPEARYLIAILYYLKNDLKVAGNEVNIAISQGVRTASIYTLKGNIELADRKFEGALASYEEALRLSDPNDKAFPRLQEVAGGVKRYKESL